MQLLPNFISLEEIEKELDKIILAQQDGSKWLDFYMGSNGAMLRSWLSAVATFLSYEAIASRRESNPITGKLRSTVYNAAMLFGYPVNRPVAARIKLSIRNRGNSVFWNKSSPVCYFAGSPCSLLESQQIIKGDNVLDLVVGEWRTQETRIQSDTNYHQEIINFDGYNTTIDYVCNNNLNVYVNQKLQKLSKFVEDVQSNKVIDQTFNDYMSIMFGGVSGGVKLKKNDIITIDWLQIKDISGTTDSIVFDGTTYYADLTHFEYVDTEIISRQTPADSLQKIIKLLPGYYSARRRAVNPDDHSAIVCSYPGIASAQFGKGVCNTNELTIPNQELCESIGGEWNKSTSGCCTNVISYLRYDKLAMTDEEEQVIYEDMAEKYMIEGSYLIFRQGIPVTVMPKIVVVVEPDYAGISELETYVKSLIAEQCYILGGTFRVSELVAKINNIKGVNYCSIIRPYNDLSLSWLGYFNEGTLDLRIVTSKEELLKFGTEKGGYLLYSDTVSGFALKAYTKKFVYRVGEVLTIEGYTSNNGEVLTEQQVFIEIGIRNGNTFHPVDQNIELVTGEDGTFHYVKALDKIDYTSWNYAKIRSIFLGKELVQVLDFSIIDNSYAITADFTGEPIVGKTIQVSAKLTKNGKTLVNTKIHVETFQFNKDYYTDDYGFIKFDYNINSSNDTFLRFIYSDIYGQSCIQSLSLSPEIPVTYNLDIGVNNTNFLVGEVLTTNVLLYTDEDPLAGVAGQAIYLTPIFKGTPAKDTTRVIITDSTGRGKVTYMISNQLVQLGFNGVIAYYYKGNELITSAQTHFTVALNPNGSMNGFS